MFSASEREREERERETDREAAGERGLIISTEIAFISLLHLGPQVL